MHNGDMGLFQQQRVTHNDSMVLPGEPLDRDDLAASLPEPGEVDLFGVGPSASHVEISIVVPPVEGDDGDGD